MAEPDTVIAPLFVPANRPERFPKAASSGADAVILDLEDAVAANDKALARQGLARQALGAGFTRLPVFVRINAVGTLWHRDDVLAVQDSGFAGVILPKADMASVVMLEEAFSRSVQKLPIIALIETARGLADCREIAAQRSVTRLAFGSIDYSADIGCSHSRPALQAARSELVLASRLAEKPSPLDGVTTAIDDAEAALDDARYAQELGFGGKLCIHPKQISHVLAGFRPTAREIAWAQAVLDSGDGAVLVDGAMVDAPVRQRARAILARAI